MFKIKKIKHLFFFILILLFTSIVSEQIEEITLSAENPSFNVELTNLTSTIFYIKGSIPTDKKYLIINSKNDPEENTIKQSPFLYVTKQKNFDISMSYDYTSIDPSPIFGNKLVIPQNYFNSSEINGFYLNVTCPILCNINELTIEFDDAINLNINEKFSYYSGEKDDDSIEINIELKDVKNNENDKLIFILNGGDSSQLQMTVNDKKIFGSYIFGNLLYSKIELSEITNNSTSVKVYFKNNVKFYFNTQIISSETNEKYVFEGEYNQFFAIEGNKKECFNIINLNSFSVDYDYDYENSINRDILIINQNNFEVNVTCAKKGETNQKLFLQQNENDNYVLSSGLNCLSSVNQICIKSLNEDLSFLQIHIQKRINENNYDDNKLNRKMFEPLMNDITYKFTLNQENTYSNNMDNKHINIHSHSQFYEKNNLTNYLNGLNIGVHVLYGTIKIYKNVCNTFPYCNIDKELLSTLIKNENSISEFQTIFGEGGYYSISINSIDEYYSMSNKQSIIIIVCQENNFDGCSYEITYYNMQTYKTLINGNKITKYLSPYLYSNNLIQKDNYAIYLHKTKKIILDLIVYSGDAYLFFDNLIDDCNYEEHHFGSNERRIIICNSEIPFTNNKLYIPFEVRANINSAYYSVYYLEKDMNDYLDSYPMETTIMESIGNSNRNIKIIGKYFNDPPTKANSYYVSIFNTMNCDLKVINMNNTEEYFSKDNEDIVQDIFRASKRVDLFFQVKKTNTSRLDNKNCIYYISSFDSNNEESSLIIPESKPFKFKLNYDIKKLRVSFPFAYSSYNNNQNPRAYFGIYLINKKPIKLNIQIGTYKTMDYILFKSKNIDLLKDVKLRDFSMTKIIITIQLYNTLDEAIVSFNINTNNKIPYSIKQEKFTNDVTINNDIKYYMSVINKNTEGEILVNFNKGSGEIFARLVSEDHLREVGGWNNRYILPNEFSDKNILLPFDYYSQKVSITKEYSETCNQYCYLLFGVKTENKYNFNSNDYLIPYNIYLKLNEYDEIGEEIIHFIDLPNNEYISNKLNNYKSDYYKIRLYDFDNSDLSKIIIDFHSDYCSLSIGLNTNDFNSKYVIDYFNDNNLINEYQITKDEIINLYNGNENIITDDFILYIKVSNEYYIDYNDLSYRLRINVPTILPDVKLINNLEPISCSFTQNKKYFDILMQLDTFDYKSDIEIYGLSLPFNKIKIFANLYSSDNYTNSVEKELISAWPTDQKYKYSLTDENGYNYLFIQKSEIEIFDDKIPNDLYLLIRVYGEADTNVKIFTSLLNNNISNDNSLIIPPPNTYQLINVNNNHKNISFNIPTDNDYSIEIIPLYGKGTINYNNKNYQLSGNYEPLTLIAEKNNINNVLNILNDNSVYYTNDDGNNNFKCLISYKKFDISLNVNKLSSGSNNIQHENVKFPLNYYVPIHNFKNKNLTFNIFFEKFLYNYEDNNDNILNGTLIKNYTEDFVIKGYLVIKRELLNLLSSKDSIYLIDEEFIINGNYDISHRYGYIFIDKNSIYNSEYLYVTIDKAPSNKNNYYSIKGKASLISPEINNIQIPSDTYILGYFPEIINTTNQTYKVDLLSFDNINSYMKVEFTSIYDKIKLNISGCNIKGKNVGYNELIINKFEYMENFGKDIYILNYENLKEIYFTVENNNKSNIVNCEYTIKYSIIHQNETYDNLKYKPNLINNKFNVDKYDLNLTFDTLKYNSTNLDCYYYISIIEKYKINDTNNNTISLRENSLSTALYKIDSNDFINDSITINLHTYTNRRFYVNVLAEDKKTYELFGYEKMYINTLEYTNSETNSEERVIDFMMLIIIAICILIFIILVIICTKYCCNSKGDESSRGSVSTRQKNINIDISQGDSLLERESNETGKA